MTLKNLTKQNIIFLGLGVENLALILWLRAKGLNNKITIWDTLPKEKLGERYTKLKTDKNITWQLTTKLPNLKKYSLIVRSPGVFIKPKLRKILAQTQKLTCPMQLFLTYCPTKNTIGVTGSKGKGTTASLIYELLKKGGKRVWLGGNIGIAPFALINKIKPTDWVILELSSFQLQDMTQGPKIAVITNLTREHLSPADPNNPNHHPSMADYWQAKKNITQGANLLIINKKLKVKSKKLKIKIIYFTKTNLPTILPGEHNKANLAAAIEVAKLIKIKPILIKATVKNFSGLIYRLQKIAEKNKVSYFNDSFATTPEATITALKSFTQPIILLAGGAEKKSDFKNLAKLIVKKVKFLILFEGLATPRLLKNVLQAGLPKEKTKIVKSMKEAVTLAKTKAYPGDVVLMSPACASFGMFKNYKDRGQQFTQAVK